MRIAFVGCGFVADYYIKTFPNHPELELAGVTDRDSNRASRFSAYYSVPRYRSLEELLEDRSVDIVVNLTNPRSHFAVSKASLEAGKHVYSEKPLSVVYSEAEELVELAKQRGVYLSGAPCSILGETAQTLWKALRENKIGPVRLAYAELDDGLIHRMRYRKWQSESGTPWPYKDEFEVGCTLEHAGYYITWLVAFFGPAKSVTSFASSLIPDKQTDVPLNVSTPDFSVACIQFAAGVVARLTCSIVAPHDHSLRVVGDEGVLAIDECWRYDSPVYVKRKMLRGHWTRKYPLVRKANFRYRPKGGYRMDFARGIAELAEAITEDRPCRLSSEYMLHVNEIVLTIQNPLHMDSPRILKSSFDPLDPMPWAKS